MRIIAFVNGNSGPSYHRVIMPLMLMEATDVFITNNLLLEHFDKGCDLLIYNRVLPEHAMQQIRELQKKYGFKIAVDIDDYWQLDEHHVLYETYQVEGFAERQVAHITAADVVLTTNSRLAAEVAVHNSNVHIVPNAIPKQGQFDIKREKYYLTRLFWQGSVTHRADIAILEHPLDALAAISPKIKMVMAGYHQEEPEWQEMAMTYTAGLKHQYKLIPGARVAEYYSAYADADICLVPLVRSKFNGMKSNLKILEAANLALPVIASDVHPYKDMPVLYAKCSSDWVKHVHRLLKSKKRQRDAGLELQDFCDKHYNFSKINNERRQILEYTASQQTA